MLQASRGRAFLPGRLCLKNLSILKVNDAKSRERKLLFLEVSRHLKPANWRETLSMTGAVGAALGSNLCRLQQPSTISRLTGAISKGGNSAVDEKERIASLILKHSLLQIGAAGLDQIRAGLVAPLTVAASRRVAIEIYKKLHKSDLDLFLNTNPGELLNLIESGTQAFGSLRSNLMSSVIPLLMELTLMGKHLQKVPQLTKLTGLSLATYIALTFAYSERRVRYRSLHSTAQRELQGALHQSLTHAENTRLLNGAEQDIKALTSRSEEVARSQRKVLTTLAKLNAMQQILLHSASTLAIASTARSVLTGHAQVDDILSTLHLFQRVAQPLHFLGTIYRQFRGDYAAVSALHNKIKLASESVRDAPDAKPLRINRGSVTFRNVTFSYSGPTTGSKNNIDGLDIRIPGGSKVAIVGPSGSGKTTLARLILRAYDVSNGSISICDQDIRHVTLQSLRDCVTIVPQETILFNDTLRNNILCGRECADEDLEDVIHAAQLHQTIRSLSSGLDTLVGDRGNRLSGGEKQRVCLARCLLKPASIIILDEATSHQDAQTEKKIFNSINDLKRNKTIITIAHRLHNITSSDAIIFLKDGQIVECGTHDELLAVEGGHYARLWADQTNPSAHIMPTHSLEAAALPLQIKSSCCH